MRRKRSRLVDTSISVPTMTKLHPGPPFPGQPSPRPFVWLYPKVGGEFLNSVNPCVFPGYHSDQYPDPRCVN